MCHYSMPLKYDACEMPALRQRPMLYSLTLSARPTPVSLSTVADVLLHSKDAAVNLESDVDLVWSFVVVEILEAR